MFQVAKGAGLGFKALRGLLALSGIGWIEVFNDLFEHRQSVKRLCLGYQPDGTHPSLAQRSHNTIRTAL